jgi:hypothetical protein
MSRRMRRESRRLDSEGGPALDFQFRFPRTATSEWLHPPKKVYSPSRANPTERERERERASKSFEASSQLSGFFVTLAKMKHRLLRMMSSFLSD